MHITNKTKEYECCCSCKHNKRKRDGESVYCECEIDGHYIGYIASFENVCERWVKEDYNTTETKIYGQPCEDCISRKAVLDGLASIAKTKAKSDAQKSLMGRVMFFTEHLPSVAPQSEERAEEHTETHECDCGTKTDKALNLLAKWVIECGFGYDNIPEEYEKYKDDIVEMGYTEGLIYIVKMESEAQYGRSKT